MWIAAADNTPRDNPCIEWLTEALKLADVIIAEIFRKIKENESNSVQTDN